MTLGDRLTLGWQIIMGKQSIPNIYGLWGHQFAQGLTDKQGNKQAMLDNYKSWVAACVNARAKAVSVATFRLYARRGAEDYEEVGEHVLLDILNTPNPLEESITEWLYRGQSHLDLTGDGYIYLPRNKLGVPAELWWLQPDKVTIVPSRETVISHYELQGEGGKKIRLEVDEVVHIKYPNPTDAYYGASPLMQAAWASDINQFQHDYQRGLYKNGANISGILQTENKLDANTFKRLQEEWEKRYAGSGNANKTAILEQGLKFQATGINPADLDWLATNRYTRDEIFAIYGVPASILGLVEDVNRANAEANLYTFAVNTIEPILKIWDEKLTSIAKRYDDKLIIKHDSTVPDDEERIARIKQVRLNSGMTTINEERAQEGYEPVAGGDEPLVNSSLVPLSQVGRKQTETKGEVK